MASASSLQAATHQGGVVQLAEDAANLHIDSLNSANQEARTGALLNVDYFGTMSRREPEHSRREPEQRSGPWQQTRAKMSSARKAFSKLKTATLDKLDKMADLIPDSCVGGCGKDPEEQVREEVEMQARRAALEGRLRARGFNVGHEPFTQEELDEQAEDQERQQAKREELHAAQARAAMRKNRGIP